MCLRCNRNVPAVNDRRSTIEWVRGERDIVTSTVECIRYNPTQEPNRRFNDLLKVETSTSLSDTLRTESCSWSVAGASIVRSSEERNVVFDLVGCEAGCVLEATKRADARENRVRLRLSAKLVVIDPEPGVGCKYLSTTITRQRVVPEALVRSFDRSLVIVMTVSVGRAHKSGGGEGKVLHDCNWNKGTVLISCLKDYWGVSLYKRSSSRSCSFTL